MASPEPESWPDHSAELARKTVETLHRLHHRSKRGKLSRESFAECCTAIMDVTEGLMPRETFELVYKVRNELCR